MKPLRIKVVNFGSYKSFEKDLADLGLIGLFGETKSGKSTLMDMVPWVLFGTDSKESNADDVRSWGCDEPTTGECEVDTGTGIITVHRIRGGKKNDLYWLEETGTAENRGKDITETQKKIEARLGTSAAIYVAGSYIHQFSSADKFFTATAKERRQAFEKIVDLSFPIKLVDKATIARKELKDQIKELDVKIADYAGQYKQLDATVKDLHKSHSAWIVEHEAKLFSVAAKSNDFANELEGEQTQLLNELEALDKSILQEDSFSAREKQIKLQMKQIEAVKAEYADLNQDKATASAEINALNLRIKTLTSGEGECDKCLSPIDHNHIAQVKADLTAQMKELQDVAAVIVSKMKVMEEGLKQANGLNDQLIRVAKDRATNEAKLVKYEDLRIKIVALKEKPNHYEDEYQQLIKLDNPHERLLADKRLKLLGLEEKQNIANCDKETLEKKLSFTQFAMDKALEMRGVMAAQAIQRIEENTNRYLERFFDADLRITLTAKDADKIDADIMNEGNPCPWNRLSGGERCMLKLAFGFSTMRQIEDTYSVKFDLLMLDEALNGISPSIRKACFHMLEALEGEYGTIMIIDHDPGFKSQFTHKLEVVREGQWSEVHEA